MSKFNRILFSTLIATASSFTGCTKFETTSPAVVSTVPANPVVASALAAEPAHVASECPVLPTRYKADNSSTVKFADLQAFEGGVAYSLDGTTLFADSKVHRLPGESKGENYVATCRKGVLKVVVSQPSETKDSKDLVMTVKSVLTFTKYNEDGDFILQTVEGETSKFNLFISAVPSLPAHVHVAAECPEVNGSFSEQSNKLELSTQKTANGVQFRVDRMEFTVDGKHQDTKDGGDRDTYIAVCSKNEIKVFMFQDGAPNGSMVFAPQANGEIRLSNARSSGRAENTVLKPVVEAAPLPMPIAAPAKMPAPAPAAPPAPEPAP